MVGRRLGLESIEVVRGGLHPAQASGPAPGPAPGSAGPGTRASQPLPGEAGSLPGLYGRWLAEILPGPLPAQPLATCHDCAMMPADAPEAGARYFRAETKCCTFVPMLPNFAVGQILADPDPEAAAGRETVLARIAARNGVTPLGLAQPLSFSLRYRHSPLGFGQDGGLRCPHLVGERCGIWKYRESTCATWFCKHERGALGWRLFDEVRELLSKLEHELSLWCAGALGFEVDALSRLPESHPAPLWRGRRTFSSHLMGSQLDGAQPVQALGGRRRAEQAELFGAYAGRETDFFRDCARQVEQLSLAEVATRLGWDLAAQGARVRATYLELQSNALPSQLRAVPADLVQIGGKTWVRGYCSSDPRVLSAEVLAILPRFDGRPVAEVQAAIRAELGLELEEALIRRLVELQLLATAGAAPSPSR